MEIGYPNYLSSVKKHFGFILLFSMCFIALISFDEFGISWDEPTQRKTGEINFEYIFSNDTSLLTWKDRDYGVVFELALITIEKVLDLKDTRDIYFVRHFVGHLFFLIGAFFCYKLIDFLYNRKLLATIGFLLFVLHPRLYAHSFFNTKDIPFMSMFMICLFLCAVVFKKKSVVNFIMLGISIGLLINLRVMGVILPFCIFTFLLFDAYFEKKSFYNLQLGMVLLVTIVLTVYLTWPYLWTNPIEHFWTAITNMSRFRFNRSVLFNGELVLASNIAWYYIPVWFSITTPIFYLISGLSATLLLIFQFFKNPLNYLNNIKQRNNLLFLVCCFFPVLIVIILHSVLYDGWRQLFFIYPSFVMITIYGLNFLIKKNMKRLVLVSTLPVFFYISFFMIKHKPYQHVFFNLFLLISPPEQIRKKFELDYWGTSYKQALEYILNTDNSDSIKVNAANVPGQYNAMILSPNQRERLHFVPIEKSTYFITNYRWHPKDYTEYHGFKYHSIKVYNNTINETFKIK
jgi:dolichyl-phosphate-mannose-protein mannosyltransferase